MAGLLSVSNVSAQQTRGPYEDIKHLPEGAIGERITGFIETVNANDPEKVRSFVEKHFTDEFKAFAPMEEHLAVFGKMYFESDGFEFYGIRKYENETPPDEFVVIVRNKLTEG